MIDTLNQVQLAQIVSAVLAALQQGNAAKAAPAAKPGNSLEAKDRALISGFKRRGITDVVLMDRANPAKPYNVKPFKAWLEQGRMVKKGELHRWRPFLLPWQRRGNIDHFSGSFPRPGRLQNLSNGAAQPVGNLFPACASAPERFPRARAPGSLRLF